MRLYSHWLDGEYIKIRTGSTGPRQDIRAFMRALKLHALLGAEFVLSDMQVVDSAAIAKLFCDPEALAFLEKDPSFLHLRVEGGETNVSPFELAATGFRRCQSPGWRSSVFVDDPSPVTMLADEVLDEITKKNWLDPHRDSKAFKEHPECKELLQGARNAVSYFGRTKSQIEMSAKPGGRHSYYSVLKELVSRGGGKNIDELALYSRILDFIDMAIEDPSARHLRSQVLAKLGTVVDKEFRGRIWANVVQAWNLAVQRTLQPDAGSSAWLPGALTVAPHFAPVVDVYVPQNDIPAYDPIPATKDLKWLSVNLDEISWLEISSVREKTKLEIGATNNARHSKDPNKIAEALHIQIEKISQVISPPNSIPRFSYYLAVGGIAIAVAGVIEDSKLTTVGGIHSAVGVAPDFGKKYTAWRRRKAITKTLNRLTGVD